MAQTSKALAKAAYEAALSATIFAATAHDAAQHAAYVANCAAERAEAVYNAACVLLDVATEALVETKEA